MSQAVNYYVVIDNRNKDIQENMVRDYLEAGYDVYKQVGNITTQLNIRDYPNPLNFNTKSNNPYKYENVGENRIEPLIIEGEKFFNYSSILCVNTKTYVNEPERTTDGSIPDINEISTFSVPRLKVKFDYMSIEDFRRMLRVISSNEFQVTYYDYEINKQITYKMYVEPREMAELYNVGYEVLGVLGYEFSFIGTLNDIDRIYIKYYNYAGVNQETQEPIFIEYNFNSVPYGSQTSVMPSPSTPPVGKSRFIEWNTKQDGTGQKYYPNARFSAYESVDLYAMWEDSEE